MIPHHDGAIAMLFILDTPKSLRAARAAPMETVVEQGFGVLAVHDLGHTMAIPHRRKDRKVSARPVQPFDPGGQGITSAISEGKVTSLKIKITHRKHAVL